MWNWVKFRWAELSDEAKQNFGVLLAIPPAILFGLLLIWALPLFSQMGWHRYRLTASFKVDGQTVTASQSYRYRCTGVAASTQDAETVPAPCQLHGEAIAMDLGVHGKLFILMNQWNADHSALAGRDYMLDRLTLAARDNGELVTKNLPAMVTFADQTDPATAKFVDPQNLEDAFGEGVTLTRIQVSETGYGENASNLKAELPWLNNSRISTLGEQSASAQLHTYDFKSPPD